MTQVIFCIVFKFGSTIDCFEFRFPDNLIGFLESLYLSILDSLFVKLLQLLKVAFRDIVVGIRLMVLGSVSSNQISSQSTNVTGYSNFMKSIKLCNKISFNY